MRSFLLILFVVSFVQSCVSTSKSSINYVAPKDLLNDNAFPRYASYEVELPREIFFLDDASKAFVAQTTKGLISDEEKVKRLIHRIFARADLDLLYSASANTVANDTFHNAAANCLSLSIMTFAMAKEAGFESEFQIVQIPEYWTRREGYSLLNGHINLRIKPNTRRQVKKLFGSTFVVDFDPRARSRQFSSQYASEEIVLAMFYNNKAADALLKAEKAKAYAYLRQAILVDESFPGSWVNLGLLYRQNGHHELALGAYTKAISIDPEHNTAWENLAVLYEQLGDHEASRDIHARLEKMRNNNPFYHQMLAEIDRDEGSLDSSIVHYEQAIRLNSKQHQFYFGLASVYFEKGDFVQSERFLKLAKRKAGKGRLADTYVDKLDALSDYVGSVERL